MPGMPSEKRKMPERTQGEDKMEKFSEHRDEYFEAEVNGRTVTFIEFIATGSAIKAIVIDENGMPLIVNLHEMRFL